MIDPLLPEPWDGRELLTSALERHGMRAAFLNAVNGRKRDEAKRILCKVGADDATARRMIAILIPGDDGTPPE
jgi:hypothetical protein